MEAAQNDLKRLCPALLPWPVLAIYRHDRPRRQSWRLIDPVSVRIAVRALSRHPYLVVLGSKAVASRPCIAHKTPTERDQLKVLHRLALVLYRGRVLSETFPMR
jgi:hypothetical protein